MYTQEFIGPQIITFEPTDRCAGRCIMCNSWKNSVGDVLDPIDCENVIDAARDLGTYHINFAGGDPLLYPHVFSLIERAKRYGIETAIITMGTMLNSQNAKRIVNSGIDIVRFSLDAPDQELHDSIRGVHSAYKRGVNGINLLLGLRNNMGAEKPKVVVNMTVLRKNVELIPEMVSFCNRLGVDELTFGLVIQTTDDVANKTNQRFEQDVCSSQFQENDQENLLLTVDQVKVVKKIFRDLLNEGTPLVTNARSVLQMLERTEGVVKGKYLEHLFSEEKLFCPYPSSRLVISADGNVYPCSPIRYRLGNIKEESLQDIWNGSQRKRFRGIMANGGWPDICYMCCSLKPKV